MIIWQRWGILIIPAVVVGMLVGTAATGSASSPGTWPAVIGLGLAALIVLAMNAFLFGKVIDKPQPAFVTQRLPQPVVDQQGKTHTERVLPVLHPVTGQQVVTTPRSSLFFIPVRFWPVALAVLAVVLAVVPVLPG